MAAMKRLVGKLIIEIEFLEGDRAMRPDRRPVRRLPSMVIMGSLRRRADAVELSSDTVEVVVLAIDAQTHVVLAHPDR